MRSLKDFFSPKSVVLVGASERSMWSHGIAARFREYDYGGKVFAVNRSGVDVHGYPGFTRCRDIGEPVDAAYIFVPAESVYEALEDAAAAGIKSVVILSSGFAEAGDTGRELQERISEFAEREGITLLGPNSLGFANAAQRRALSIVPARLPLIDGGVAVVSQSGAALGEITKFAYQQGVGLCFQAATGNEAQLGIAELVEYLVEMPECKVITVFAESIRTPRRLREAAVLALAACKPIIIFKVGRSEISAKFAQAHTGSLVSDDRIFDAICEQYGLIRVNSIEELIITAALLEKTGPLARTGVALVSLSGGACGMFADHAQSSGVELPDFSEHTQAALRQVLPQYASPLNPLDITGGAIREPELWEKALPLVGANPSIGLLLVSSMVPVQPPEKANQLAQGSSIARGLSASAVPGLLITQTLQPCSETTRERLGEAGIPSLSYSIEYTGRAVGKLIRWSQRLNQRLPSSQAEASSAPAAHPLRSEAEVLDYLRQRGVPVIPSIIAADVDMALRHAAELGCPVAMKVSSPDVAHKTEVGGIKLDAQGKEAVAAAFRQILDSVGQHAPRARIDGILVAPMREQGIELFVGTKRDPQWGPVIAVGLGGIWVELLKDMAVRPLPISQEDATANARQPKWRTVTARFPWRPGCRSATSRGGHRALGQCRTGAGIESGIIGNQPATSRWQQCGSP